MMLGRLRVPAARLRSHAGDSGRNGRMMMSGMAGMTPDITVYRQGACGSVIVPPRSALSAGSEGASDTQRPLTVATSSPPSDEKACV